MSDAIVVRVVSFGNHRCLMLAYRDPVSGRKVCRSSGTFDRRQAERAAAIWQDELTKGLYKAPSKITWGEFLERYEAEHLAGMPESTQDAYRSALGHVTRVLNPDRLARMTTPVMSGFVAKLRAGKMKATTIARHLRHVKAALRWGERQGLLAKAPNIEMPKVPKGDLMKGRPLSGEEFERLLDKVPSVVGEQAAASWRFLLLGLWWGGLRLGEALALDWSDGPFTFDTSGRFPVFRIEAAGQKSRRDEFCPAVPDFCRLLESVPEAERVGKVFKVVDRAGRPVTDTHEASRIIAKIGRAARVVTDKAGGRFATAHDLRRSFCTRWSKRVMPPRLQRLARHASIHTTLTYYAHESAADLAADLWAEAGPAGGNKPASGNTCGNTEAPEANTDPRPFAASPLPESP